MAHHETDVAVIGAGPAGLATACCLALSGIETTLLAAPHRPAGNRPDTRTAALFNASIKLLEHVGAWTTAKSGSAPMAGIRLIDDTGGLLKAPEVLFEAREIGETVFGYNVPQGVLTEALRTAATHHDRLTIRETAGVTQVSPDDASVTLTTEEGDTLGARLVAAADGRNSIGREGAGIKVTSHGYDQAAVTCLFQHTRPHADISTEFHRKAGPCTVVPLPGNASSLVWVERPTVAQRLYDMPDQRFMETLDRQLRGLLGSLSEPSPRALFPLKAMSAETMAKNRVALIGEAAHVMPPIGAQGLNLSLRDAATLSEVVAAAHTSDRDIGADDVLADYNRKRGFDVRTRGLMVDVLNRALITEIGPIGVARGAALHAIRALPPLKAALMREGMRPTIGLPELMR